MPIILNILETRSKIGAEKFFLLHFVQWEKPCNAREIESLLAKDIFLYKINHQLLQPESYFDDMVQEDYGPPKNSATKKEV